MPVLRRRRSIRPAIWRPEAKVAVIVSSTWRKPHSTISSTIPADGEVPYWDEKPILYWRTVKPFRVHVVYYIEGQAVHVIAYAHEAR